EQSVGQSHVTEVCAAENCTGKVHGPLVTVRVSAANDSHSGLYIRPGPTSRCITFGLTGGRSRPRLLRVLADECRQDVHHRRMVKRRVTRDAFKSVNGSDAYIELVGSELLDRFGVAIGDLPLFEEFKGPP